MKTQHRIIAISFLFAVAVWIIDAVLDYLLFYKGSLAELLITQVPSHEIYIRLLFMASFLVFGFLISGVVTRRQRAQEALGVLSARHQAILQAIPDIIMEVDANKVYSWANQAGYEFFGQDVLGQEAAYFFEGEQSTYTTVQPIFNGAEDIIYVESWQRRRDGEKRLLAWWCRVLKDGEGNPAGALSSARDITDQVRLETALRETEGRLHTVVANAPLVLFATDERGVFTVSEGKGLAALGLKAGQVVGLNAFDVYDDVPDVQENLHRALAGETISASIQVGDLLYESHYSPVRDENHQVIGVIGVSIDITQRVRAEEELRKSEQKYRALFSSMNEGSALHEIIHDASGQATDYVILDVNPSFEAITGLAREQAVGTKASQLYGTGAPPFLETYAQVTATGQATAFEVHFPPMEKHFLISAFSPAQGQFATVFTDITHRMLAQAEREALIQELEAKNAELERFTYTVSHDLKSPLITIKGFLGFLQEDAATGDTERLQADINRISSAAEKMRQLLDELLELSRIGRLINPPEVVPVGALVREALEMVAGQIDQRGVQVEIAPHLLGPDGPTVFGDRTRLREVLENLVSNAIKFMGDQPKPCVEIGARPEGEQTVFFVRDNGTGIDPRYHERVFGLFDKLNPDSEGSGIGLAIVKRIVEVHGGRIWIESDGLGHGAAFCFTLPKVEEKTREED